MRNAMPPITPPTIAPTGVPWPASASALTLSAALVPVSVLVLDVLVVEAAVVPGILVSSRRLVVAVLASDVDCFDDTCFVGVAVWIFVDVLVVVTVAASSSSGQTPPAEHGSTEQHP